MSILKALKWFLIDQFTFGLGGGGGGQSQPTQTNVQNTNIPEYARPYVETMLGTAQQQVYDMSGGSPSGFKAYQPYSTNPTDYVASLSPLQTQAFGAAGNMQTPGQFGAGTSLATAGGIGTYGAARNAQNAGANFAGMATNPYAVQSYMNPYLSASLQPQLAEIGRQGQIASNQAAGQATAAGAFGGTRGQLAQAEAQRNAMMAQQQAIGQGYNQAYQQAQNAMQYGAGLGLQGQQAAMQGYGQMGTLGAQLGALGTQQNATQQANINLQNTLGSQQQTQQQNIINQAIQNYATAQQYPMQQLANMSALLRGLPLQNTTTQSYAATPTALSTLAGLGTGIAGASKLFGKKGGLPKDFEKENVKGYIGGGIMSLANRERIAEDLTPQQLDTVIANKTIPQDMGKDIQQDNINMAQREMMANAAAQAAAQQDAGITAGQTNLPAQTATMAQGGIVAFAGGKLVKDLGHGSYAAPDLDLTPTPLDDTYTKELLTEAKNKKTGKAWTEEEIAQKQRAKEESMGIKDIFKEQMEENKADRAKLAGKKDQAMGSALLSASGEIFKNASLPGFGGIGAGLSKFSSEYGSAMDKIDANDLALRKEGNAIQAAQMQMKQAQLKGDTEAYNAAEAKYTNALDKANTLAHQNQQLQNEATKASKIAQYDYRTKMDVQSMANEAARLRAQASQGGKTNSAILGVAQKMMAAAYPAGAMDTLFKNRPDVYQAELNRFIQGAQSFITTGNMPAIPQSDAVTKLLNTPGATTAAKPSVKVDPKVQSLLDKYPAAGGNTEDENEE